MVTVLQYSTILFIRVLMQDIIIIIKLDWIKYIIKNHIIEKHSRNAKLPYIVIQKSEPSDVIFNTELCFITIMNFLLHIWIFPFPCSLIILFNRYTIITWYCIYSDLHILTLLYNLLNSSMYHRHVLGFVFVYGFCMNFEEFVTPLLFWIEKESKYGVRSPATDVLQTSDKTLDKGAWLHYFVFIGGRETMKPCSTFCWMLAKNSRRRCDFIWPLEPIILRPKGCVFWQHQTKGMA